MSSSLTIQALLSAPPAFGAGAAALSRQLSAGATLPALLLRAGGGGAVQSAELVLAAAAREAAAARAAGAAPPTARALRAALALHSDFSPAAADAIVDEAARVRARRAARRACAPLALPPPPHSPVILPPAPTSCSAACFPPTRLLRRALARPWARRSSSRCRGRWRWRRARPPARRWRSRASRWICGCAGTEGKAAAAAEDLSSRPSGMSGWS